jgi:RNA polymerase sigma factor (sigma-70 family)
MKHNATRLTDSQREVVEKNINFAYYMARKWKGLTSFLGMSEEDAYQEAMFALCQAARTFDPKKTKFSFWAGQYIDNQFRMMNRRANTEMRSFEEVLGAPIESDSGHTTSYELALDTLCPVRDIAEEAESSVIAEQLLSVLSDQERRFTELVQQGHKIRSIARMHGLKRHQVVKTLDQVGKKIAMALGRPDLLDQNVQVKEIAK